MKIARGDSDLAPSLPYSSARQPQLFGASPNENALQLSLLLGSDQARAASPALNLSSGAEEANQASADLPLVYQYAWTKS